MPDIQFPKQGKAVKTSLLNFIQINRSEELKRKMKHWIGRIIFDIILKSNHDLWIRKHLSGGGRGS